jgi:hypothetical protein
MSIFPSTAQAYIILPLGCFTTSNSIIFPSILKLVSSINSLFATEKGFSSSLNYPFGIDQEFLSFFSQNGPPVGTNSSSYLFSVFLKTNMPELFSL